LEERKFLQCCLRICVLQLWWNIVACRTMTIKGCILISIRFIYFRKRVNKLSFNYPNRTASFPLTQPDEP
jgi:hypothetical protein